MCVQGVTASLPVTSGTDSSRPVTLIRAERRHQFQTAEFANLHHETGDIFCREEPSINEGSAGRSMVTVAPCAFKQFWSSHFKQFTYFLHTHTHTHIMSNGDSLYFRPCLYTRVFYKHFELPSIFVHVPLSPIPSAWLGLGCSHGCRRSSPGLFIPQSSPAARVYSNQGLAEECQKAFPSQI